MKPKNNFLFCIFLFLLFGCSPHNNLIANNNSDSLILVGSATSLEPVLTEIDNLYTQKINYTFASSGVLQRQIEQGANIDIFISASDQQMNTLEQKNLLLTDTRTNLVTNQIALITNKDNNLTIESFSQLKDDSIKLIAMGEPKSVPAGQYAQEILENLNIFSVLESQSKLLFTNSVRATLASVETGNVDVGIVYLTDAKSSDKIKVIAVAHADLHSSIIYPMAIIKNSKNVFQAQKYLEFLQTEQVQNIFVNYGFNTLQE